jgi:hypothetical protein
MVKKIVFGIMVFLVIAVTVFAGETFMIFNTPVTVEFLKNAPGQGHSYALYLRNAMESERIRYKDDSSNTENTAYIVEIVRRHTIRRGDIYLIGAYFSLFDLTKVGVCEFTSDAQYTYWFYTYTGR